MFRSTETLDDVRNFPFMVRNKKRSPVWSPLDPYPTIIAVRDYLAADGCNPEIVATAVVGDYRAAAAILAEHPDFADASPYRRCVVVLISNDVQESSRCYFGFWRDGLPGFVMSATTFRTFRGNYTTPATFAAKACEDFYDATFDLPAKLATLRADKIGSPRLEKVLVDAAITFPRMARSIPDVIRAYRAAGGSAYDLLAAAAVARPEHRRPVLLEMRTQLSIAQAVETTRGLWTKSGSRKSRRG